MTKIAIIISPLSAQTSDLKKSEFKIGFITILSGSYSDFGQASANAALLAVEDYRSENPGEMVNLLLEDDAADAKKGLSAFLKLKNIDKADLILPISTFSIGPVRSMVNREKRLTLILGNEPYEPEDDYIFMLSPAAVPAEEALGAHAAKENPSGKLIVFTSQNEATLRFANAIKKGIGSRAEIIELPSGEADYASIVTSVKSKKPSAVIFCALPMESAKVIKALNKLKFTAPMYFDETVSNSLSDFKTILGDISFMSKSGFLFMNSNMDRGFVARYQKRFGVAPQMWTDYAYDLVRLALFLKDRSSDEARQWLKTHIYLGVSGSIEFDSVGLRKPNFSIGILGDSPGFQAAIEVKK